MKTVDQTLGNIATSALYHSIVDGSSTNQEFIKDSNGVVWLMHCRSFYDKGNWKFSVQFVKIIDQDRVTPSVETIDYISKDVVESNLPKYKSDCANFSTTEPVLSLTGSRESFIRKVEVNLSKGNQLVLEKEAKEYVNSL